jgi:hypothetical protein
MSYSWISNFVPVEWYLAELWPLNFFLQILSCLDFVFTSFELLTWYLVCGYIYMISDNLKSEKKYKFKGHNSAKDHSTSTKSELKLWLI